MRLSSFVRAPRSLTRASSLPIALAAALALAGCASDKSTYRESSYVGAVAPPQPAIAMEADGLPVQTPPLRQERPEIDDPTEPFSRNYGPSPSNAAPSPVLKPLPKDQPRRVRTQLAAIVDE